MPVPKPLVAFLFAALYGLSMVISGQVQPALLALALPLIWLSVVDFCEQIIPDSATVAVAVLGIVLHGNWDSALAVNAFVSMAILAVLWLSSEVYWRRKGREALGLGDVKLLSASVLCVGAAQIWLTVLIACSGGIAAVAISRLRSPDPESGVPFGPFIGYGLFLTILISGAQ